MNNKKINIYKVNKKLYQIIRVNIKINKITKKLIFEIIKIL